MAYIFFFGVLLCVAIYASFKLILDLKYLGHCYVKLSRAQFILIWGIAVASMLQTLFGTLIVFISTLKDGLGDGFLCNLDGFATSTCAFAIIHQFAVLCFCNQNRKFIEDNLREVVAVSWIVPLFWSSFPLFGIGKNTPHGNRTFCCLNWESNINYEKCYFYALFIFAFFLPSFIIVSAKFKRDENDAEKEEDQVRIWEIAVGFLLFWLPYGVTTMSTILGYESSESTQMMSFIAAISSFVLVPLALSRQLVSIQEK